jgi:hypothetical protein
MFKNIGLNLKSKAIKKAIGIDSDINFNWKFGHTEKENEFVVLIESDVLKESQMKKMYNRFLKTKYKMPFERIDFSKDLFVGDKELSHIKDYLVEAIKPKRFVPKKYKVVYILLSNVWFSNIGDGYLMNFEFVGVHA